MQGAGFKVTRRATMVENPSVAAAVSTGIDPIDPPVTLTFAPCQKAFILRILVYLVIYDSG